MEIAKTKCAMRKEIDIFGRNSHQGLAFANWNSTSSMANLPNAALTTATHRPGYGHFATTKKVDLHTRRTKKIASALAPSISAQT